MTDGSVPEYDWWPDGATVGRVRACNCDWCTALIEKLDAAHGEQPATDEGDLSLEAFA